MKEVRLNNGITMPAVGFGVFQIPAGETERVVSDAIETGYRLIDTASAYFNEEQVGSAIRKSGVPREDIFLTTKVWVEHYGQQAARSQQVGAAEQEASGRVEPLYHRAGRDETASAGQGDVLGIARDETDVAARQVSQIGFHLGADVVQHDAIRPKPR